MSTPVSTTDGNIQSFDLEVGFKGAAHLAYDQFWFDETRENMDIRYTWSARPPYATWSAPVTVSDETNQRLQGSPTLAVQACKGRTILHLAWSDSRLASPALNDVYDIFYARKKAISGAKWSKNVRVSDRSSSAFDPGFPPGGDMDLAVAGDTAIAAWPDRRNVAMYDRDLDVYVSQISHWHGLSLRPRAPHRPPVCCPDHRRIPCPQPSASAPTNNWMPLQEREIRRGLRDALARNLRDVFWPIKEPLKARVSRAPVSGIRLRYPHRGDHDG